MQHRPAEPRVITSVSPEQLEYEVQGGAGCFRSGGVAEMYVVGGDAGAGEGVDTLLVMIVGRRSFLDDMAAGRVLDGPR